MLLSWLLFVSLSATNIGVIYRIDSLFTAADTMGAVALNEALTPTNLIEQNHKTVTRIFLNHVRDVADSCASGSTVPALPGHCCHTLNSVANQCPYLGGVAVYQARALLAWGSPVTLNYNDDCLDSAAVMIREEAPARQVVAKPKVQVYPNPTRDEVFIYTDVAATFELYNLLGAQISTQMLHDGETRISTVDWAAGTYFIFMKLSNGSTSTHKIIIIK